MTSTPLLTDLPSYPKLQALASTLKRARIDQFFIEDPLRTDSFRVQAAGLKLDYSKQLLTKEALTLLLQLADEVGLQQRVRALVAGEPINSTEQRPALHSLLRAAEGGALDAEFRQVCVTRERMKHWVDRLHQGAHSGFSGQPISDVVNIGIGGSDLGPRLTTEALKPYQGHIACHYVANVDPTDLQDTLSNLNPASTLFIVCSKSFRTEETLANGLVARQWLLAAGATAADMDMHFLAVTCNREAAAQFGISANNCLPLWDWVGGRYSVWSAVGLSSAIAVGWPNFERFLEGARGMDEHFLQAPGEANMPLLMSLLEIWYCNFFGAPSQAVLPYSQHLKCLPEFLQQLTMESNGKRVTAQGTALEYSTAPLMWGVAGTMGQHSFHQWLHQGTSLCPVDFVLPLTTHSDKPEQLRQLVANCLAQSRALMIGRSESAALSTLLRRGFSGPEAKRLAPHLVMPGNRPSSTITFEALTPETLGALLALYEHRTFCSGQLWGVNPFDQWGVELGKEIGAEVLDQLMGESNPSDDQTDPSTSALANAWKALN
jgi:glucose-6-phosphate isomerase